MDIGSLVTGAMITAGAAATAVTGGVSAGAGESVSTQDSSASVQIVNTINANDEGGLSETIVETILNGEKKTENYTQPIVPGGGVIVNVAAEAKSTGGSEDTSTAEVEVASVDEEGNTVSVDAASSTIGSTAITTSTLRAISNTIIERVSEFFYSIFTIFFW